MYFKEIGKSVELFTGNQSGTKKTATDRNIVWETIGFKNLFEQIKEVDSSIECCRVSPFGEYWTNTNEGICNHPEALCKKECPKRWNSHFGDSFKLMTSEEAFESGIFGLGTAHARTKEFLGEYVAIATGDKKLWFDDDENNASGHLAAHAGLLKEEMIVPLILIER